jgi:Cytochrome P460
MAWHDIAGSAGNEGSYSMKRILLVCVFGLVSACLVFFSRAAGQPQSAAPQFTADGKLVRPEGYRKWVFVSSGYGMSYSQSSSGMQMFTNVFVTPAAYDYFVAHGKWPDKTMFVLEVYDSTSRGSINKHGSYQTELSGLDVEVKDEARFADKWAYFNFDNATEAASADTPSKNDCWKCHEQNAAVEHSFVQFYPELLKIARAKGTTKPGVRLDE